MKTVVAGASGKCAHVAGMMNFLQLAEAAGWRVALLLQQLWVRLRGAIGRRGKRPREIGAAGGS